ncbi:MAG: ankyrin repeat domain-containing protein [Gallionella sp.]
MLKFSGISSRSFIVLAGLFIVAGAGAYYYFVFLPESESKPAKVAQTPFKPPMIVKKPPNVAKAPVVQGPPAASAVPAAPVASAPVAAPVQLASAPPQTPVPVQKPETVKPEPVEQKPVPKKPKVKSRPVKSAKTSKPPSVPEKYQQITPPVSVMLPEPVATAAEPTIITPKYNDMLTAALRGDLDGVRQLLEMGRWVDKPGSSGLTPLMAGVMNRDTQMVQLLLEHGAEPTVQALKLAQKNKDAAMASLLQQHGAR